MYEFQNHNQMNQLWHFGVSKRDLFWYKEIYGYITTCTDVLDHLIDVSRHFLSSEFLRVTQHKTRYLPLFSSVNLHIGVFFRF